MFRKLTPFLCLLFRIRLVKGQSIHAALRGVTAGLKTRIVSLFASASASRATTRFYRDSNSWQELFRMPGEYALLTSAAGAAVAGPSLRGEVDQERTPTMAQPRPNGKPFTVRPVRFLTATWRFIVEKKIPALCFVIVVPASLVYGDSAAMKPAAQTQSTARSTSGKPDKASNNKRGRDAKKTKGKKSDSSKHKPSAQEKEFDQTLMGIYG